MVFSSWGLLSVLIPAFNDFPSDDSASPPHVTFQFYFLSFGGGAGRSPSSVTLWDFSVWTRLPLFDFTFLSHLQHLLSFPSQTIGTHSNVFDIKSLATSVALSNI